jgi:raffinose/stachyose/melibiose transport system permease protein
VPAGATPAAGAAHTVTSGDMAATPAPGRTAAADRTALVAVGRARRTGLVAYLYLLPLLIIYTLFVVWPTLETFALSLYRIDGIMIDAERLFVGLGNFGRLVDDPAFWQALRNNLLWTVFSVTVPVVFGLLLAALLATRGLPLRAPFRVVLFLPQVLALVVVGLVWSWMFNPYYGPINRTLSAIGLSALALPWLGDYLLALPALLVANAWHYYGFCMVIFLAAIQGIDESLYDAAKVDGAGAWQRFRFVTMPGLRHAFTVVVLIMMIDSFKVFDLVRITTNGGPGESTLVLSLLLYKKVFFADDVGYGAAVAVVNTLLIITLSTAFSIYRRRVETRW